MGDHILEHILQGTAVDTHSQLHHLIRHGNGAFVDGKSRHLQRLIDIVRLRRVGKKGT